MPVERSAHRPCQRGYARYFTEVSESNLNALIAELIGDDPERPPEPKRPTLAQARRRCQPGQVLACRQGRQPLVLAVRPDGRETIAHDRCPHDGGPLSDGFIDGDQLVCSRHGWAFDLDTGECPGRAQADLTLVSTDAAD